MSAAAASPRPVGAPETRHITAMGADGEGVAPSGDGAQPLHAPFTLPAETVRLQPLSDGRAMLQAVLEASAERVIPPCPHFGVCGGCALQHWDHAAYLAWKVERLRLTLARRGLEAPFDAAYAAGPGERRRVALHARHGPGGVRLGFKGRRSWTVQPIHTCVIAAPAIVAALPALEALAAPFLEHPASAPILHVTATLTGLNIDVTGVAAKGRGLSGDARLRAAEAAMAADFARVTLAADILYGARAPVVRFDGLPVVLPPGGFLQASEGAEQTMAAAAVAACAGATAVADLFCGAGAFAFALARGAEVLALDSEPAAIAALKAARDGDRHPIVAEARDLFRRPLLPAEMKRLDAVVFDPPRAGAIEQARMIAASAVSVCVAVSCNPETFVRDAEALIAGGFRLERVLPVDQFLWSPHMELVGVFRR